MATRRIGPFRVGSNKTEEKKVKFGPFSIGSRTKSNKKTSKKSRISTTNELKMIAYGCISDTGGEYPKIISGSNNFKVRKNPITGSYRLVVNNKILKKENTIVNVIVNDTKQIVSSVTYNKNSVLIHLFSDNKKATSPFQFLIFHN